MFVKCPQCHTVYRIEKSTLSPNGSKMRCAKCRQVWRALPDSENEQPSETPLLESEAFRFAFSREDHIVKNSVNPRLQPEQSRIIAAVLLLLALFAAAAYFWRRPLTETFPQTAAFYQKLERLRHPLDSKLKITGLIWSYEEYNRKPSIRLYGEITNPTTEALPVPSLKITLYNREGKLIRALTVIPAEKNIASNRQIRFQTVFPSPEMPVSQIYAAFEE